VETAEFIAQWCAIEARVDPLLVEQEAWESGSDFRERIQKFAKLLKSSTPTAWVGHGDFMPLVLEELGHPAHDLKKGDLFWLENGRLIGINPVHASEG
jgi:broad specificity phosphatase PhoE